MEFLFVFMLTWNFLTWKMDHKGEKMKVMIDLLHVFIQLPTLPECNANPAYSWVSHKKHALGEEDKFIWSTSCAKQ